MLLPRPPPLLAVLPAPWVRVRDAEGGPGPQPRGGAQPCTAGDGAGSAVPSRATAGAAGAAGAQSVSVEEECYFK